MPNTSMPVPVGMAAVTAQMRMSFSASAASSAAATCPQETRFSPRNSPVSTRNGATP